MDDIPVEEKFKSLTSLLRSPSDKNVTNCFGETKENLMKFAEILYKCTLCTTMPSILTSEISFMSHVSEQHLNKQKSSVPCTYCELRFETKEDLKSHIGLYHTECSNSSVESNTGEKATVIPKKLKTLETAPDLAVKHSHTHGAISKPTQYLADYIKRQESTSPRVRIPPEESGSFKPKSVEHDPKINIAHGPETANRSPHSFTSGENIQRAQEVTEEILARNCGAGNLGNRSSKVNSQGQSLGGGLSFYPMNMSSTPEFGNYTKLVREGGSIVYFCQVCNWKSQIKVHFEGHCKNKLHVEKVRTAEDMRRSDLEDIEKRKMELPLNLSDKIGKQNHNNETKINTDKLCASREKNSEGEALSKKKSPVRPNKRKRPAHSVVHYYDKANDYSSDSDSSNSAYFIPRKVSPHTKDSHEQTYPHKKMYPSPSTKRNLMDLCSKSPEVDEDGVKEGKIVNDRRK